MPVVFAEQLMGTELLVFERTLRREILKKKRLNLSFKRLEVGFVYPSLFELENYPEDIHSRLHHANIYAVYKIRESASDYKILINSRRGVGPLVLLPATKEEFTIVENKANALLNTMYQVMKTRWKETQPLLWGRLENGKQDDYKVVVLINGGSIRFFFVNSYTQLKKLFLNTDEGITSVSESKLDYHEAMELTGTLTDEEIASYFLTSNRASLREGLRKEAEDEAVKQLVLSWVSARDFDAKKVI